MRVSAGQSIILPLRAEGWIIAAILLHFLIEVIGSEGYFSLYSTVRAHPIFRREYVVKIQKRDIIYDSLSVVSIFIIMCRDLGLVRLGGPRAAEILWQNHSGKIQANDVVQTTGCVCLTK